MKTVLERFWSKVSKTDECWCWTGAIGSGGYGNFWDGERSVNAHRFSFEQEHGPLPEGVCVLHRCDNRRCVRPDHLFPGTQAANLADMRTKGRDVPTRHSASARWRGGNPKAKITAADAEAIRTRYGAGDHDFAAIARAFGLSVKHVRRIVRGERWRHGYEATLGEATVAA